MFKIGIITLAVIFLLLTFIYGIQYSHHLFLLMVLFIIPFYKKFDGKRGTYFLTVGMLIVFWVMFDAITYAPPHVLVP